MTRKINWRKWAKSAQKEVLRLRKESATIALEATRNETLMEIERRDFRKEMKKLKAHYKHTQRGFDFVCPKCSRGMVYVGNGIVGCPSCAVDRVGFDAHLSLSRFERNQDQPADTDRDMSPEERPR